MSIAAEKAAEMLALPNEDRAFLVRELLASLDHPAGDQGSFAAEWAS